MDYDAMEEALDRLQFLVLALAGLDLMGNESADAGAMGIMEESLATLHAELDKARAH